jgi:hypothetical protein
MKRMVWLVVAALLAGCAERTYEARWGQDTQQFKQDYYRCVRESQEPWASRGIWLLTLGPLGIPVIQVRETQLYEICMDAAGWDVVKDDPPSPQ